MAQKITWEEMKRVFPNEWLLITDFVANEFGEVVTGVVEKHAKEMDDIASWPTVAKTTALRYTGESTFAGLRSHAENEHAF